MNSNFYFIWTMPKGVHANGGVTRGIYFMYNYFFEKNGSGPK